MFHRWLQITVLHRLSLFLGCSTHTRRQIRSDKYAQTNTLTYAWHYIVTIYINLQYNQYSRNSTWFWAKSIWFGVPILASIIVYICNVHWVGDLNLYSIHWLLGDLSVKLIWRSTITILHICKYVWCPLSWGPKYSFDMVYVDFLVAYYCLARTPEVLIPNLMQAEKVIL